MKKADIVFKPQEPFRKLEDVEHHLRITERKLHRLKEKRWSFTKNMLKFGLATWVFGLSIFFLAIVVVSVNFFPGGPPIWTCSFLGSPLLVGAPAAPVTVTAVFAQKFDAEIRRLTCTRKGLVAKYKRALLQHQMVLLQHLQHVKQVDNPAG